MRIIREFETMLNEIQNKERVNGVAYQQSGTCTPSIGQEASAVGEAYSLDIDDLTFRLTAATGKYFAKGLFFNQ